MADEEAEAEVAVAGGNGCWSADYLTQRPAGVVALVAGAEAGLVAVAADLVAVEDLAAASGVAGALAVAAPAVAGKTDIVAGRSFIRRAVDFW